MGYLLMLGDAESQERISLELTTKSLGVEVEQ